MRLSYLKVAAELPGTWPPDVRYPIASTACILADCDGALAMRAVAELARVLELDTDTLIDTLRRQE